MPGGGLSELFAEGGDGAALYAGYLHLGDAEDAGGGVLGHVVVIAQGYDLAFALGELRDGLAQGDALYYALRLVPAAEHLLQCEAVLAALAL